MGPVETGELPPNECTPLFKQCNPKNRRTLACLIVVESVLQLKMKMFGIGIGMYALMFFLFNSY